MRMDDTYPGPLLYIRLRKCYTLAQYVYYNHTHTHTLQIDALSAEGDVSEEQQQVLTGLEDRVNQAIELFEEDGALVRVNGRSVQANVYCT